MMASSSMPTGDAKTSRKEPVLGRRSITKRTPESVAAFCMFVHVAELVVVLLGLGFPVGTTTFTV